MPPLGASEHLTGLAAIPLLATLLYYALPGRWQASLIVQFCPQVLAYGCLILWARQNQEIVPRLGLKPRQTAEGARLGLMVGIGLGTLNTFVILWVMPALGIDIDFLKQTPHARAPGWLMLPWGIMAIAVGVELNFRGFLLGRLLTRFERSRNVSSRLASGSAVAISALAFSFDPFMVATFRDLHWIAVWDGMVWGMMWVRRRNLYATIVAHAVEVMVMYSALKLVMAP